MRNTSASGRPTASARGQTRQRLGRRVEEGDPGLVVGRDDRVTDALERDRVAPFAGKDAAV